MSSKATSCSPTDMWRNGIIPGSLPVQTSLVLQRIISCRPSNRGNPSPPTVLHPTQTARQVIMVPCPATIIPAQEHRRRHPKATPTLRTTWLSMINPRTGKPGTNGLQCRTHRTASGRFPSSQMHRASRLRKTRPKNCQLLTNASSILCGPSWNGVICCCCSCCCSFWLWNYGGGLGRKKIARADIDAKQYCRSFSLLDFEFRFQYPAAMFEMIAPQLTTATEKLTHLRRFL